MVTFAEGRGIACSIALIAGILPVHLDAPDQLSFAGLANEAVSISAGIDVVTINRLDQIALAEIEPPPLREALPPPTEVLPPPAQPAPARFFTINEVLAKAKLKNPTSPGVRFAAIDPTGRSSDADAAAVPVTRGDEPFGLFTFKAPEGLLWVKWRKAEADIEAEAPALARCRASLEDVTSHQAPLIPAQAGIQSHDFKASAAGSPLSRGRTVEPCTPGAARFVAVIKRAAAEKGRAQFEVVNRMVNDAIRYTSDIAQWGVVDRWSAPVDVNHQGAFDTGLGDCEDYAIAKYVALREAGVPAPDLRLLLVRDNAVHMDHAVLAARDGGHWLILDNRWSQLTEDTELWQIMPLFALDETGVKLFAAPYAQIPKRKQTIVAGAGRTSPDPALAASGPSFH